MAGRGWPPVCRCCGRCQTPRSCRWTRGPSGGVRGGGEGEAGVRGARRAHGSRSGPAAAARRRLGQQQQNCVPPAQGSEPAGPTPSCTPARSPECKQVDDRQAPAAHPGAGLQPRPRPCPTPGQLPRVCAAGRRARGAGAGPAAPPGPRPAVRRACPGPEPAGCFAALACSGTECCCRRCLAPTTAHTRHAALAAPARSKARPGPCAPSRGARCGWPATSSACWRRWPVRPAA